MKKNYIKIICIVFAILIISISPLTSYLNSYNSCVYAFEATIDDAIYKYIFPVGAYMAVTYEKTMQGIQNLTYITAEEVQEKLSNLTSSAIDYAVNIPVTQKLIIGKLYTELTNEQINQALGTSYSDTEIDDLTTGILERFNSDIIGSSYRDAYDLGIPHIAANYIAKKYNTKENLLINEIYTENLLNYTHLYEPTGTDQTFTSEIFPESDNRLLDVLEILYLTSNLYFLKNNSNNRSILRNITNYYGQNIQFTISSSTQSVRGNYISFIPIGFSGYDLINDYNITVLEKSDFYTNSDTKEPNLLIENIKVLVNGVWHNLENITGETAFSVQTLLDDISVYTGIDYSGSSIYQENKSIADIINQLYEGTYYNTSAGSMAIPYGIPAIDSGFFTGEDVSKSDAERLVDAIGTSTATWDIELQTETKVNDDPDTNIDTPFTTDVTLSPTTELDVPDVNTANPDESGDIGNPDDTTGILGWLKGFWDLLKALWEKLLAFLASIVALLTSIFTNTGNLSEAAEGTDWGNFKGFFDIFWIFYYLIILAIIILLKFFSVIISMLAIPANTALFDAYPTMLSGLNYIKNIKVGGFNVTLQVIFEYMFTVFFFLYIVTTLQKLYHSFMGIERVQRRENEREARYEKYDNERHYEPNNFTKGMMHANEQKPNNGLSFKDEDYENIKFTDWGD